MVAAGSRCFAVSGIPAFHAAPPPSSPVYDRDPLVRNVPAPPARFASQWKAVWSRLSRRRQRHLQAKPPSPANKASPASPALSGRCARVPPAPRALFLAPAVPHPVGMRLRHSPAAAWLATEIALPLCPTGRRRHTLRPAQGELQADPVAASVLRGIPFPRPASAAARSSFPPSPGAHGQSRDKPPATYQSTVSRAARWLGQGNKEDQDH